MEVSKTVEFDAGHRLMHHEGKCSNIHGHRYTLKVSIIGIVNKKSGMVLDFTNLKQAMAPVVSEYDHAMILNKEDKKNLKHMIDNSYKLVILSCEPTAENIAIDIKHKLYATLRRRKIVAELGNIVVTLNETKNSQAVA